MSRARVSTRVLLVEDDRRAHQLLREVLIDAGCDVCSALTIADGLRWVDVRLNCAILDLRLPDGDGETILREIRSERLPIRVAVLTAEGDPERLRRLAELRPDLLLKKPIDLPALIRWLDPPAARAQGTPRLAVAAV